MTAPVGTFIARVLDGGIQLPPAIHSYCGAAGWTLFRFAVVDRNHMIMRPVLAEDAGEFHASLDGDGRLWIPAELRAPVGLGEQSVMLRVEDGSIGVYLRKVFDTLGFRPR
jgi:hypothetical protein